jgi:hypothetical protein
MEANRTPSRLSRSDGAFIPSTAAASDKAGLPLNLDQSPVIHKVSSLARLFAPRLTITHSDAFCIREKQCPPPLQGKNGRRPEGMFEDLSPYYFFFALFFVSTFLLVVFFFVAVFLLAALFFESVFLVVIFFLASVCLLFDWSTEVAGISEFHVSARTFHDPSFCWCQRVTNFPLSFISPIFDIDTVIS